MAQITITIPDAQKDRILDAFCAAYGYTPDQGSKAAFAKARLIDHIRNAVLGQERAQAERAAVAGIAAPTDPGMS